MGKSKVKNPTSAKGRQKWGTRVPADLMTSDFRLGDGGFALGLGVGDLLGEVAGAGLD